MTDSISFKIVKTLSTEKTDRSMIPLHVQPMTHVKDCSGKKFIILPYLLIKATELSR